MLIQNPEIHKICFNYIRNPQKKFDLDSSQMKFLHTFLGERFIAGYRIFETIQPSIIVLKMMQFNTLIFFDKNTDIKQQYPHFQIVCLRSQQEISYNKNIRTKLYKEIHDIYNFLQAKTDIYILYLNVEKQSKISLEEIVGICPPMIKKYYQQKKLKNTMKFRFKGCQSHEQGQRFHKLVEIYIKGATKFRNQTYAYNNINHFKFNYFPDYVLNTVSYLIGKQVIQQRYIALSSQKWMRRSIVKKFKRYDLILRNENYACILDWKFSTKSASDVMNNSQLRQTAKLYYQLASRQYKAGVKLKYYGIHQQIDQITNNHHIYTHAQYEYQRDTVQVEYDNQLIFDKLMKNPLITNFQQQSDNKENSSQQKQLQYEKQKKKRYWIQDYQAKKQKQSKHFSKTKLQKYQQRYRVKIYQHNTMKKQQKNQYDSDDQLSFEMKLEKRKKQIDSKDVIDLQQITTTPIIKYQQTPKSHMIILDQLNQSKH